MIWLAIYLVCATISVRFLCRWALESMDEVTIGQVIVATILSPLVVAIIILDTPIWHKK